MSDKSSPGSQELKIKQKMTIDKDVKVKNAEGTTVFGIDAKGTQKKALNVDQVITAKGGVTVEGSSFVMGIDASKK